VLDVHALKESTDFERFRSVSLWPAILMLQLKLMHPVFQKADPTLWDRPISVAESLCLWRSYYDDPVVRFKLWHLSTPLVNPFLQVISNISQDADFARNSKAQLALKSDMQRALMLLWVRTRKRSREGAMYCKEPFAG
jgi:hypothetical protein